MSTDRSRAESESEMQWLDNMEKLVGRAHVDDGLRGLLGDAARTPLRESLPPAPSAEACEAHDWAAGRERISTVPPIDVYPNFLSDKEVQHLLRLGLCHAAANLDTEAAAAAENADGYSATAFLPSHLKDTDPVLAEIENRCAIATRVPLHEDEPPITIRFEGPVHTLGSKLLSPVLPCPPSLA